MASFSERYSYTKPSDIIIRERINPEIQNAICNAYSELHNFLYNKNSIIYSKLQSHCWTDFMNKYIDDKPHSEDICINYFKDNSIIWYKKMDLLEFSINYLDVLNVLKFVNVLNSHFKRLNFAYQIIDDKIIEISSQEEINVIEEALSDSNSVRVHLQSALQTLSIKPDADVRNSIKESISAVEAICRDLTGENTLGRALSCLEKNNIIIPPILKKTFETLYIYTNDGSTGIRHALMDDDSKYIPTKDEAIFMLVACSAFVNYLRKKQIDIK